MHSLKALKACAKMLTKDNPFASVTKTCMVWSVESCPLKSLLTNVQNKVIPT